MMDTQTTRQCVARVYSVAFRAPRCLRRGKVERDGKWYCTIHDPARLKAKADQRGKERQDARRKSEGNMARAETLARQLGAGRSVYLHGMRPSDPSGYAEGVLLSFDEVEALLRRLMT